MEFLVNAAKTMLVVALMLPFSLSVWPVVQASSFYDATVPQEQSCVPRGHNRYRC
jgi:hypothetical protein